VRRLSSVSKGWPLGLLARRAFAALAALIVLVGLTAPPAQAAVALGTAVGVLPAAVAQLGGQEVTILLGDQLFEGQTIVTSPVGEVQVVFVDDTRMVIGPNSSLVIERILMRDATSFSSLVTNALGGTFRFITGSSPHSAYQMNTPAGTIAVRGTAYDLTVEPFLRRVDVMVYLGGVELCPPAGRCVILEQRCAVGNLVAAGASIIRSENLRMEVAATLFPYLPDLIQAGLLEDFRVADAADCGDRQQAQAPETPPAVVPVEAVIVPVVLPPIPVEPPPASDPPDDDSDECKDGGWDDLGFRNQGQCIRMENTGVDTRPP
jgi:hypothetical protein